MAGSRVVTGLLLDPTVGLRVLKDLGHKMILDCFLLLNKLLS